MALTAACDGTTGVVAIELRAEPGSDLLTRVDRVRLELDDPPTVAEATRTAGGSLALNLDIPASGGIGRLSLEAFDSGGSLIGVAASAPVPLSAIDGILVLYLAPEMSIGAAPVALEPPRAEMAIAALPFGAIFLGGNDSNDESLADVDVYNVYDHAFQVGDDLPRGRASAAAVSVQGGLVYVFGGTDGAQDLSAPIGFDTTVEPAGEYFELEAPAGLERSAGVGASLGASDALFSGTPAVQFDGVSRSVIALTEAPTAAGTLTTSELGGAIVAVAVGTGTGESGAAQFSATGQAEIRGPPELLRSGHAAAADADGDIFIIGGTDESGTPLLSALRYRAQSGDFVVIPEALASARIDPAIAITEKYIVVAGGTDELGTVLADAIVFGRSLNMVAAIPLVVGRRGASAVALENGQVLILGGRDQSSEVIATMELFSPDL